MDELIDLESELAKMEVHEAYHAYSIQSTW